MLTTSHWAVEVDRSFLLGKVLKKKVCSHFGIYCVGEVVLMNRAAVEMAFTENKYTQQGFRKLVNTKEGVIFFRENRRWFWLLC